MSPFGIDIVDDRDQFQVGDKVSVHITYCGQENHLTTNVIARQHELGRNLACLRFTKRLDGSEGYRERKDIRWDCDSLYTPLVKTSNPDRPDKIIYFRAIQISLNGMLLQTSARNRYLAPGLHFNATMTFPLGRIISVSAVIKHVQWLEVGSKPSLNLGIEVTGQTHPYEAQAGAYLLEFGSRLGSAPTPRMLRAAGFPTRMSGANLEFSYVRSRQEYEEVLRLRALSFGVSNASRDPGRWSDAYDAHSRIIIGRFRGKVIVSGRLIFHDSTATLEHNQFIPIPPAIPHNQPLTEVGRVCTDPDFRGDDLLVELFRFYALALLETRHRYMIGNSVAELLPAYESMGVRPLGVTFVHPNDQQTHHVFLFDLYRMVCGVSLHPVKWMVMVGEIWDEIEPRLPPEIPQTYRLRLRVLVRCRPILARALARFRRKRGHRLAKPVKPMFP